MDLALAEDTGEGRLTLVYISNWICIKLEMDGDQTATLNTKNYAGQMEACIIQLLRRKILY